MAARPGPWAALGLALILVACTDRGSAGADMDGGAGAADVRDACRDVRPNAGPPDADAPRDVHQQDVSDPGRAADAADAADTKPPVDGDAASPPGDAGDVDANGGDVDSTRGDGGEGADGGDGGPGDSGGAGDAADCDGAMDAGRRIDVAPDDAAGDAGDGAGVGGTDAASPADTGAADVADVAEDVADAVRDVATADADVAEPPGFDLPPPPEEPAPTGVCEPVSCVPGAASMVLLARGHDLMGLTWFTSSHFVVSPGGRLWLRYYPDIMTIGEERVPSWVGRDHGIWWPGWPVSAGPDNDLVVADEAFGLGLLRLDPRPELRVLVTGEDYMEQTDADQPMGWGGVWDEGRGGALMADRGNGWIWSVTVEGEVTVLRGLPSLRHWGIGPRFRELVLGRGGDPVFAVGFEHSAPSHVFEVPIEGEPRALVTPDDMQRLLGICRDLTWLESDPDGALTFAAKWYPEGQETWDLRYFRYSDADGLVLWPDPDVLAPFLGQLPRLLPDPDGGYWFVGWCHEDAPRECFPYSGSLFHFDPPAGLRLEVPWVDLALAAESSRAELVDLAVTGDGAVVISDHDDFDGEGRFGVYRAPVGEPPVQLAAEDDLWAAFAEEFYWRDLDHLLVVQDGGVLAVADRYGPDFDARDAVIRIDQDGTGRIIGDGEPFPFFDLGLSGNFRDLALSPDGNLVVLDETGVFEVPPEGGEPLVRIGEREVADLVGRGPNRPLLSTFGVAGDGTIVAWEVFTGTLLRLPPDGPPEATPAPAVPALLGRPEHADVYLFDGHLDPDGNLVASAGDVVAVTPEGDAFFAVDREALQAATVRDDPAVSAMASAPGGGLVLFERNSRRLLRVCPAE